MDAEPRPRRLTTDADPSLDSESIRDRVFIRGRLSAKETNERVASISHGGDPGPRLGPPIATRGRAAAFCIRPRRRAPDPPKVLQETVRAAIAAAHKQAPDLPLIAGGKSMGGRISSHVAADNPPPELKGLVFLGYPLHAAKQPAVKRAEHLSRISIPMLFLQGTRDDLADLTLLTPIVEQLGPSATMHIVEGGNHSFKVLKRSGRTDDEVMAEIADVIDAWARELTPE